MKIRTIFIASVEVIWVTSLVSKLNYLLTLDLSELNLNVIPHSFGELKHLRYLNLSKNEDIEFLRNSIIKPLNLLTLILHGCRSLIELPGGPLRSWSILGI